MGLNNNNEMVHNTYVGKKVYEQNSKVMYIASMISCDWQKALLAKNKQVIIELHKCNLILQLIISMMKIKQEHFFREVHYIPQ